MNSEETENNQGFLDERLKLIEDNLRSSVKVNENGSLEFEVEDRLNDGKERILRYTVGPGMYYPAYDIAGEPPDIDLDLDKAPPVIFRNTPRFSLEIKGEVVEGRDGLNKFSYIGPEVVNSLLPDEMELSSMEADVLLRRLLVETPVFERFEEEARLNFVIDAFVPIEIKRLSTDPSSEDYSVELVFRRQRLYDQIQKIANDLGYTPEQISEKIRERLLKDGVSNHDVYPVFTESHGYDTLSDEGEVWGKIVPIEVKERFTELMSAAELPVKSYWNYSHHDSYSEYGLDMSELEGVSDEEIMRSKAKADSVRLQLENDFPGVFKNE